MNALGHCAYIIVSADLLLSFSGPSPSSHLEGKLSDIQEWAAAAPIAFRANLVLRGIGIALAVFNFM